MNILLTHRVGGAWGYITDGYVNALRNRNHCVERWDGNLETWERFKPDVYIGCSGHRQPIPPKRNCKIAIHVNPYGPVDLGNINESIDAIRWTLNQQPDAVFGYGHDEDRIMWSYWSTKHKVPWVPMPTAGDKVIFKQIIDDAQKEYDLVYLGGRWPYKAKTIDAYLVPVLNKVKSRVYGWGDWPSNVCSGVLGEDKACQFLNSGKIGPCVSEQHTHTFGIDIPERAFKVALCGTLVVHDATINIKRMIPSAVIASTPEQFRDYVEYFAKPAASAERIELIKKQQTEVLNNHTYHHRLAKLLDQLGYAAEASDMVL